MDLVPFLLKRKRERERQRNKKSAVEEKRCVPTFWYRTTKISRQDYLRWKLGFAGRERDREREKVRDNLEQAHSTPLDGVAGEERRQSSR